MDSKELLITSSRHTQQHSACLWDYHTGNMLHFYKNGGIISPKTLNFLGSDYLVSCDENKPLIHIWPLNSQEPNKRLQTILADKATALTVCPKNAYIAAGIGAKLYIWHISSGKLFSVQKRNFQPITCVKFSSDGFMLAVTGQDGMLIVYNFVDLISFHNNYSAEGEIGQATPLYTKNDHSLPITDLFLGTFAEKSRLATVSSDQTCKIYALQTGQLLLSLVFSEPLTTVLFDGPCWNLYVGSSTGKIYQYLLKDPPRTIEHHFESQLVFQGHEKRINCLDLNITNTNLVSGSDDNFVFVWEIESRQILRRIEHKSSITNVQFVLKYKNFFVQNFKPKLCVRSLDRELIQNDNFVDYKLQDYDLDVTDEESEDGGDDRADSSELENECFRLKVANKQLYDVAVGLSRKINDF